MSILSGPAQFKHRTPGGDFVVYIDHRPEHTDGHPEGAAVPARQTGQTALRAAPPAPGSAARG
eukprot:12266605-Alexandrium_andersonii.AAC.1